MKRMAVAASITVAFVFALAAAAAEPPEQPFNGKDLTGWKLRAPAKASWAVGTVALDEKNPAQVVVKEGGSELINTKGGGSDIITEAEYGDCILTCEVFVPKGSNSGIYLMGRYEVQILDSFGKTSGFSPGDMGGIYTAAAPKDPVFKKPGEWNTFEIRFQAPKFDADGKKTANAKFIKIVMNGGTIHENVEVKGPTGGQLGGEVAKGPLMFQGDHGPVAYRNIKIVPLK